MGLERGQRLFKRSILTATVVEQLVGEWFESTGLHASKIEAKRKDDDSKGREEWAVQYRLNDIRSDKIFIFDWNLCGYWQILSELSLVQKNKNSIRLMPEDVDVLRDAASGGMNATDMNRILASYRRGTAACLTAGSSSNEQSCLVCKSSNVVTLLLQSIQQVSQRSSDDFLARVQLDVSRCTRCYATYRAFLDTQYAISDFGASSCLQFLALADGVRITGKIKQAVADIEGTNTGAYIYVCPAMGVNAMILLILIRL